MNVFEAVKQNVTTRQAAELYGIRVGRNGMAVCPFHNDKNPSMKLDRRFHCFGCQADGDAVDFVSRLFGLPSKEAAMKIADDFGISYDSRQKPSIRPKIREPTPEQKYQQEENHCYKVLSDYFHLLRKWEKQYAPQRTDEVWHTMDFLPLDRSGNRRFLPIMVHPENAEVHILEDEAASRAFIDMMWAEAMFIYQNFPLKLTLSKDMDKELKELQKQFMPEDTKAGLIQSFLDNFKGTQVCSKLIYAEALNHPFDEPKQWEIREINEIMNNSIEGWKPFSNPRSFAKYGRQRGWERIPPPDNEPSATGSNLTDGFRELTEEEARQMELPF